uniref:Wax synthase domain-containing protein n=1 Tax=Mycena chlorophos TaxID=658473 RepID=A0ABQ0LVU2_MYCCL|nr:predicted protein [Mycena chlorophos]
MALEPIFAFHDAQWALYIVLMQLPLIVKPSPYRPLFFVPILALTVYTAYSTKGRFLDDYYVNLQWMTYFWTASDHILLTDVQRELRQVPLRHPDDKNGIEHTSLWRRICWGNSLFFSPRGVGWAHEPTDSLPPHPPADISRTRFVLQRLRSAIIFFLIHDACNLHVRWNPMYWPDGPGYRTSGWMWRLVATASWGLSASTMMCLLFTIISIVAVGSGLSEPYAWPAFMGSPRDAYTLRRFWGRTWHQVMRRFVSAHGRRVVQALNLKRGSNASSYTQLYVAFLISAIIHYIPEVIAMRSWHGGAFIFFTSQALAITCEDFVIWLGRRAGLESVWWCYEPLVRRGQMTEGLPVSVIAGVWKGQWILPPFPTLYS